MQSKELTEFIDEVCSDSHLRVEADLGDGFVRLRIDEAERRQAVQDIQSVEDAVVELLRNSRDAQARNIYLAYSKEDTIRSLVVIDDGCGIPESFHEAVFEPRVTSKLDSVHMDKWGIHGRGMALYSIRENSTSARVAASGKGLGAAVCVDFDTSVISEKRDQSTFPSFSLSEGNRFLVRGPHNILRVSVEFALEHRSSVNVFLGSPSEVAATLYANAIASTTPGERAFGTLDNSVPVTKLLAYQSTPEGFSKVAEQLGIFLSPRTARRILDATIKPIASLSETVRSLLAVQPADHSCSPDKQKCAKSQGKLSSADASRKKLDGKRPPALSSDDLSQLADAALAGYLDIADSYYLSKDIQPEVKLRDGNIVISIPMVNLDE